MNPFVLALALFMFLVYIYKFVTGKATKNYPPGPPRLPLFGSYLHLLWENSVYPHLALQDLSKKYNSPVIGLYLGDFNVIVANDYASCKEIFTRPELQGRIDAFPLRTRALGQKLGIFDDDGPEWLHMRRFSLRELRDLGFGRRSDKYETVLEEETRDLVETLRQHCERNETVDVPQIFFPALLNCIFHIISGNRLPVEEHSKLKALGDIGERFLVSTDATGRLLAIMPWVRFLFPETTGYSDLSSTSQVFNTTMRDFFREHRDSHDSEALRDLIDVYFKNQEQFPHFTDDQLLMACVDLTFPNTALAGFLGFALIYMIQQPHVQERCQKELDEVVGRGRLPSLHDRPNLPYLEATLREVLRRQTLAPLGFVHRATEDTMFCGYEVPKDTALFTNIAAMHMDEKLWGDPENFRPERFLDSRGMINKKDMSLPFGLGKRVCAGETFARQNMFVIFAATLQNFTVEEDTLIDFKKCRSGFAILPQADLKVKFTLRE